MVAEGEAVDHADDVLAVVRVIVFDILQETDFYLTLLFQLLFIPDDLECNINIVFMIKTEQDNPKRPLTQLPLDLIPKPYMVMCSPQILPILIVITPIVRPMRRVSACLPVKQVQEVHSLILLYLIVLRGVEISGKSHLGFLFGKGKTDLAFACVLGRRG